MDERASLNSIDIVTIVDRNVTAAVVRAKLDGRKYKVTGSAKREKHDVFNPGIGRTLAIGRALRKLAAALEADGTALVQAGEQARQDAISRRVQRSERRVLSQPGRRWSMSVEEIMHKFGQEAADRATRRRLNGATAKLRADSRA